MGEVKVTQDDRDAAANAWARRFGKSHFEDEIMDLFEGRNDQHPLVQDFARHRQAAEKAQQERDAAYIEGRVKHYQAKIDKADPDDVELIEMRQHTIEALEFIATAIRSQGHE